MAQSNPYPWQVARGDGIALRRPSRHGAEEDVGQTHEQDARRVEAV